MGVVDFFSFLFDRDILPFKALFDHIFQQKNFCVLGTQTAISFPILIQSQFRQVPRVARDSSSLTRQKIRRFERFLASNRPSPETRQKRASHYSSRAPEEFSYYSKVRNAMGLSIGLISTLATSQCRIFSVPMLPKPPPTNSYHSFTLLHRHRDIPGGDPQFLYRHYYLSLEELSKTSESAWFSFGGVQGPIMSYTR